MSRKVIRVTADWCKPCQAFGPIVDRVAESLGLGVEVLNYETDSARVSQYRVRSLPTLVLVGESGEMVDRLAGAVSTSELRKFLGQS